jgi:ATP-binding cassette subfamily F protein uup
VFEGDGRVQEYVGGYEDWLRQSVGRAAAPAHREPDRPEPARPAETTAVSNAARKLSYNEQRELEALPARIDALEAEQRQLSASILDPDFYRQPRDTIAVSLARSEAIGVELVALYERWDELDSRRR